MVSDNAINSWSTQDLSLINVDMLDLGPDINVDMLGLKDFVIEPLEKFEEPNKPKKEKKCPHCSGVL